MSSQELQAVLVNDELMLARPFTLEDGSIQWRNKFGLALEGAQPVDGKGKPKAAKESGESAPRVQGGEAKKRQAGTGKGTQGKKPQAGGSNRSV
jgi:hypothetical protein